MVAYLAPSSPGEGGPRPLDLGKNSVGTKQLKKKLGHNRKTKNKAITAAKIKPGTITGTQIDSSTPGTASRLRNLCKPNRASGNDRTPVGAPGEPASLRKRWQQCLLGSLVIVPNPARLLQGTTRGSSISSCPPKWIKGWVRHRRRPLRGFDL